MQSAFFKSICQIGIFMVCAQTITHFRPNSSYEKYMKLLVSGMVLIQILQPMGSLFHIGGGKSQKERVMQLQEQFDAGMADAMESISKSEQILENMTLREVQKALEQEKQQKTSGVAEEPGSGKETGQGKDAEEQGQPEPEEKERTQDASGNIVEVKKIEKISIGLDGGYGQQD